MGCHHDNNDGWACSKARAPRLPQRPGTNQKTLLCPGLSQWTKCKSINSILNICSGQLWHLAILGLKKFRQKLLSPRCQFIISLLRKCWLFFGLEEEKQKKFYPPLVKDQFERRDGKSICKCSSTLSSLSTGSWAVKSEWSTGYESRLTKNIFWEV